MCLFIIVIGNFFLFISGGNQKDIGQNHHGVCVFCCFVGFSWRGNQRNVTFPYLNKIKSGCELYFPNLRFGGTPSPS